MNWKNKFKKKVDFFLDDDDKIKKHQKATFDETITPQETKQKHNWFNWKQQGKPASSRKKVRNNINIFANFRRRKTLQIIKYLEQKKIDNCFFYTDVNNIPLLLEQGIRPTGQIKLLPSQEYIVWTYLEHATYLELELGNSTRHFFWKWCTDQRVNLNQIAIISIDINRLFEKTNKDWDMNLDNNRLQIYEIIPVNTIDWMLIKDKKIFRLAKMYNESQNLKIKIFEGHDGQITS